MKKTKRNKVLALILALTVLMGLCSACSNKSDQQSGSDIIGISMHNIDSERWTRDGETLKAELEKMGYEVVLTFTNGSGQAAQIDELLEQDIKVLVVTADEPGNIGSALEKAAKQGVKVLAYDRMPMNTDAVDAIATFDSRGVGRLQAERVLRMLQMPGVHDITGPIQVEILGGDRDDPNAHWVMEGVLETLAPYIESGEIADPGQADELLSDSWSQESGYDRTKALLDEGSTPDVILCGSDDILAGCIEAIQERDNLPTINMMGQDAILAISRHIGAAKDKTATVFKDSRLLAKRAAELVDILARGADMPTADDTLDNGNKAVNAYFAALQTVDFFNYRTALIDSGYYTAAELNAEPDEPIIREAVLAQLFTFEDKMITDTEGFAMETGMIGEVYPGAVLNIDENLTIGDVATTYKHYCSNTGLLDEERKELPYTNLAEIPDWVVESLEFCNYYGILDWIEGDQIHFDSPITRLEAEKMYSGLVEAVMNQYESQ